MATPEIITNLITSLGAHVLILLLIFLKHWLSKTQGEIGEVTVPNSLKCKFHVTDPLIPSASGEWESESTCQILFSPTCFSFKA